MVTAVCVLQGGGRVPSTAAKAGRGVGGHGDRCPLLKLTPLSLFYVSQASFHPVLDCVVFSLGTLISRCNEQKSKLLFPGVARVILFPNLHGVRVLS